MGLGLRHRTPILSRMVLGKPIIERESRVGERERTLSSIQSITGHVESGEKTGGPPSKPKYYLMTDSGEVL